MVTFKEKLNYKKKQKVRWAYLKTKDSCVRNGMRWKVSPLHNCFSNINLIRDLYSYYLKISYSQSVFLKGNRSEQLLYYVIEPLINKE